MPLAIKKSISSYMYTAQFVLRSLFDCKIAVSACGFAQLTAIHFLSEIQF